MRTARMSATMSRMGRKPKPPDEKASERLQIRVTARDKAAFKATAERAGKPLATWLIDELKRIAYRKRK